MSYYRFDPNLGFERFIKQVSNIANEIEKEFSIGKQEVNLSGIKPAIDITETDKSYIFEVELPGLTKNDVNIKMSDDRVLTISGNKNRKHQENKTVIREERKYGDFIRTLQLPEDADINKVNARYDNGLLELTVMKKEPETPKTIEIKID